MANQEHLDILKQGTDVWNQWRKEHWLWDVRPDLRGTDLSKGNFHSADLDNTILVDVDFHGADLHNINLRDAKLSGADLHDANLRDANLYGADLLETDLRNANLDGADLSGARLNGANLSGARLNGANLSRAHVFSTIFADVDLRTIKGLVEVRHNGPSIIQLHTVKLPQDGSLLHFLRGVGVPSDWIDFYRIQMTHPVQYHSCFISYSHYDEFLAKRLHADLQEHGVRCWFAPEDMKIGDKVRARIDEAIHLQDKLMLLLSKHALVSTWVEDEVEAALEKEQRQQREVLFPVRLDESMMQTTLAWAAKLRRTRHVGDFTHWTDPQAYQQAFERLLRDLKAQP